MKIALFGATGNISAGHVGTVKGFQLTREDLAVFLVSEIELYPR